MMIFCPHCQRERWADRIRGQVHRGQRGKQLRWFNRCSSCRDEYATIADHRTLRATKRLERAGQARLAGF